MARLETLERGTASMGIQTVLCTVHMRLAIPVLKDCLRTLDSCAVASATSAHRTAVGARDNTKERSSARRR